MVGGFSDHVTQTVAEECTRPTGVQLRVACHKSQVGGGAWGRGSWQVIMSVLKWL